MEEEGRREGRRKEGSNEPIRTAMGKMSAMVKGLEERGRAARRGRQDFGSRLVEKEEGEQEGWLKDDGGREGRKRREVSFSLSSSRYTREDNERRKD